MSKNTDLGNLVNGLFVSSTRNVGVGTTTPANALVVDRGNATASYLQFTAGTTTGVLATDGFEVGIDASGNGIINQQENLPLMIYTNATERMRITATGNVGIGVIPSAWSLGKALEIGNLGNGLWNASATDTRLMTNVYFDGTLRYGSNGTATMMETGLDFVFRTAPSGTAGNAITFTERMRITSGGQVNINSTQTTFPFYVQASIANWMTVMENSANGSSGLLVRQTGGSQGFYYGAFDGSAYKFFINGSGIVNSTSTSITIISSDEKLKTDIRDYDKGLAEVLAMKPRVYKRKDNLQIDEVGFIAQEMDIALKGSMIESYKDEKGEPIHTYQLEWYPLLVKAIQELKAEIEILKQK